MRSSFQRVTLNPIQPPTRGTRPARFFGIAATRSGTSRIKSLARCWGSLHSYPHPRFCKILLKLKIAVSSDEDVESGVSGARKQLAIS